MPTLTITVTGPPKSGKSLLARILADLLGGAAFHGEVRDEGSRLLFGDAPPSRQRVVIDVPEPHRRDERPDWADSLRVSREVAAWYWVWSGDRLRPAVPCRVYQDAFGGWAWSIGREGGQIDTLHARYPWFWSSPIQGPGR